MSHLQDHDMSGGQDTPQSENITMSRDELNSLIQNAIQADRLTQPPAPTTPQPTNNSTKEKVSKLSEFSGNTSEWDSWHIQAKIKLESDGALIGSLHDQFGYLY